jgi:hypothetical protein
MKKRIIISLAILMSIIAFLVVRSCSQRSRSDNQTTKTSLTSNLTKSDSSSTEQKAMTLYFITMD